MDDLSSMGSMSLFSEIAFLTAFYGVLKLQTLGPSATHRGEARSISDNGQIVGCSYVEVEGNKRPHAALYDSTGGGNNIDLGTLPGHDMSYAYSVNNAGQAVGSSRYSVEQGGRATIFDLSGNGNNLDLGTLGGPYSDAMSINNLGQIVGGARPASGGGHATLFDPTGYGNNIDLGTLGGAFSSAWAINDNGQIVGQAADIFGDYRATLFDPSGGWDNIDLNTLINPTLGWDLQYAMDINNLGINPDGYERAFLLTPVPAPGAFILGTLGLGIAGWRLRRREEL